jgi:pilus assembly protein CpaE
VNLLSFLVVSSNDELYKALEASGRAKIVARVDADPELKSAIQRHGPDALLVDLAEGPNAVLQLLESLPNPRPMLLVHGPDDSQLILRAMRLGAREYLSPCEEEKDQIRIALQRLMNEARPASESADQGRGKLLAVMGAKGGVGTSFVATQLAAALARSGASVAIADVHLRLGDVAVYLDLRPRYTIASLAGGAEEMDATSLQTVLVPHSSGVRVLAAPERPEDADIIGPGHMDRAVALLQDESDWVVADVPGHFDECAVQVLDRADHIVLVTSSDVPALHHTRLQLDLLQRLGHSPERIQVVANRVDKNAPVSIREIRDFLGREIDARLPNDYPNASACVNEGRTICEVAPRSSLCHGMGELSRRVHQWCEISETGDEDGPKGLLSHLLRRRNGSA